MDQEKFTQKSSDILQDAKMALQNSGWDGYSFKGNLPDGQVYMRVRTESLNLIGRACGRDSDHYQELQRLSEPGKGPEEILSLIGVLEAAIRDFEGGYLFDMKALIRAEVLTDFIEQAEVLLDAGYRVGAAAIAGAVLEDTLRKLCDKHAVPYEAKTSLNKLNGALAKAQVYDALTNKRITQVADIRNNADHGHFDKFTDEDVADMIKWTTRFTSNYL